MKKDTPKEDKASFIKTLMSILQSGIIMVYLLKKSTILGLQGLMDWMEIQWKKNNKCMNILEQARRKLGMKESSMVRAR